MSDRSTPETDAVAEAVGMGHFMVDAEFARKLERERDEAMQSAEAFSALAWKLEGERNEAREELLAVKKLYADKSKEACDLVFENRSLRIALQEIESMAKKKLDELSTY